MSKSGLEKSTNSTPGSNTLNGFKLADCPDQVKLKLTLEAIPMDKQCLLNDVTEWDLFKDRLIEEFGSIRLRKRRQSRLQPPT